MGRQIPKAEVESRHGIHTLKMGFIGAEERLSYKPEGLSSDPQNPELGTSLIPAFLKLGRWWTGESPEAWGPASLEHAAMIKRQVEGQARHLM